MYETRIRPEQVLGTIIGITIFSVAVYIAYKEAQREYA